MSKWGKLWGKLNGELFESDRTGFEHRKAFEGCTIRRWCSLTTRYRWFRIVGTFCSCRHFCRVLRETCRGGCRFRYWSWWDLGFRLGLWRFRSRPIWFVKSFSPFNFPQFSKTSFGISNLGGRFFCYGGNESPKPTIIKILRFGRTSQGSVLLWIFYPFTSHFWFWNTYHRHRNIP